MEDMYTEECVIKLLIEERTRAKDIAYDFKKKYEQLAIDFAASDSLKIINDELADSARIIGNTILEIDAFSKIIGNTLEDSIKLKLKTKLK